MPEHGTCLGDAQIAALDVINTRTETPPLQGGAQGFAGWPIYLAPTSTVSGEWGPRPSRLCHPTPVANFGLAVLADPAIRFGILQRLPTPTRSSSTLAGYEAGSRNSARSPTPSRPTCARSPTRAEKVLLLHGIIDFAIPFGNTVDWYERCGRDGPGRDARFRRFWLVPGFGHGSGVFQLRWDSLDALEAWVEEGTPPEGDRGLPMRRRRRQGGRGPLNTRPMRS